MRMASERRMRFMGVAIVWLEGVSERWKGRGGALTLREKAVWRLLQRG
jgi:hypothetical protein